MMAHDCPAPMNPAPMNLKARIMRAWICRGYGGPGVLALTERPRPVPKANEVLIRIHATSVSSADMRVRSLKLPRGFGLLGRLAFGIFRHRQPILGTELAGTVEAVGAAVSAFRTGDAVIAFPGGSMGCHAEYRVIRADRAIVPKPANLSFEQAASLPFGGTTALHFLRKAGLKAGEAVLVIGASGSVGSAMVQLARHMGADVTGVTSSANIDLVRSLGAQTVIDYTCQDFTALSGTYDIVADTVGASSFAKCLPVLNEKGRYLAIAGGLLELMARPSGTKRSIGGPAPERQQDLLELVRLAESGVLKPVIDKIYSFSQLPEAHAYVDTGRKRGSVIVSIVPDHEGESLAPSHRAAGEASAAPDENRNSD